MSCPWVAERRYPRLNLVTFEAHPTGLLVPPSDCLALWIWPAAYRFCFWQAPVNKLVPATSLLWALYKSRVYDYSIYTWIIYIQQPYQLYTIAVSSWSNNLQLWQEINWQLLSMVFHGRGRLLSAAIVTYPPFPNFVNSTYNSFDILLGSAPCFRSHRTRHLNFSNQTPSRKKYFLSKLCSGSGNRQPHFLHHVVV